MYFESEYSGTDIDFRTSGGQVKANGNAILHSGNSNFYSNTEQIKLSNIESNATADQTKSDIDALGVDAETLDGIDSLGFDAAGAADTAVSDHVALADPHSQYADQATTYTKTEVDDLVATSTESPGETTGTATFTNSTNNIALTGIGSIGLEIGDVVQVTGTASNNKLFTVEVITDDDNVIVNQAHAGGTTTKSLVNETVSATVTLVAKWFNAPSGLGQGWVSPSRAKNVTYTNNTQRPMHISILVDTSTGGLSNLEVSSQTLANFQSSPRGAYKNTFSLTIPIGIPYLVETATVENWWELR